MVEATSAFCRDWAKTLAANPGAADYPPDGNQSSRVTVGAVRQARTRRRPLPTWQEREMLRFIARQQAATVSQVAARFGKAKGYLYTRLANFVDLGLLT